MGGKKLQLHEELSNPPECHALEVVSSEHLNLSVATSVVERNALGDNQAWKQAPVVETKTRYECVEPGKATHDDSMTYLFVARSFHQTKQHSSFHRQFGDGSRFAIVGLVSLWWVSFAKRNHVLPSTEVTPSRLARNGRSTTPVRPWKSQLAGPLRPARAWILSCQ